MSRLEELRKANPNLEIISVLDPAFVRYGSVVKIDSSAMIEMVKKTTEMPETGNKYVPWLDSIDKMPEADAMRDIVSGQTDLEWGLCWGHNSLLNGLEWHNCSEINIGVTDLVLMLGKREEIIDGKFDSAKAKLFYLPEGVTIEVYSDTLHFCPCEVSKSGFSCVVGLVRGTNTALDEGKAHDPLLTAKNKWLIAHPEAAKLVANGTVVGIYGENTCLKTID